MSQGREGQGVETRPKIGKERKVWIAGRNFNNLTALKIIGMSS